MDVGAREAAARETKAVEGGGWVFGWMTGVVEVRSLEGAEGSASLSRLHRCVSSGFMRIGAAEAFGATPPPSNTSDLTAAP